MFEFFDRILSLFNMLWIYVTNLLSMLVQAAVFVWQSIQFPLMLSTHMPAIIGSSVLVVVGVAVLKFLIGR